MLCSEKQARYLWRKWNDGDISDKMIMKILGRDGFIDLFGGWFVDFYLDELFEGMWIDETDD